MIWAIEQAYRFNKKYIFYLFLNAFITGVTPVILLLLTQELINWIQEGKYIIKEGFILLVLLIFAGLCLELVSNWLSMLIQNSDLKFNSFLHNMILEKIAKFDCKKLEKSETYDLLNRVKYDDCNSIVDSIKSLFALGSSIVSIVSYATMIIKLNLVVLLMISIFPIIQFYFYKKINIIEYNVRVTNTESRRKVGYIFELLTDSSKFKELKMYSLFSYFSKCSKENQQKCDESVININKTKCKLYELFVIIQNVLDFVVVSYLLTKTVTRGIMIGDFVLYNNSIKSYGECVLDFFSKFSDLHKQMINLIELQTFFNSDEEYHAIHEIQIHNIEKIVFRNVSYCYENNEVIHNISFEIQKGERICMLGKNGSGKSTLIKLIMGLYSDYDGTILVNDIDLKKINKDSYRNCISPLFQEFIKYETTIKNNIMYGDLKKQFDFSKIMKEYCLEEFIESENERLGYQFNDGRELSIGQWQKLAIARAGNRSADLYIFDEPNSALDVVTEKKILKRIEDSTEKKISIIIIHRFRKIMNSEYRIMVLKKGVLVEDGTHDSLINQEGEYYNLMSAQ